VFSLFFLAFGGLDGARMEEEGEEGDLCVNHLLLTIICSAPKDSEIEVENMRPGIGEMRVFPSIWGHWAGGKSCDFPRVDFVGSAC
jgi:hypothetical protein